jgi:aminopeptidase N
MSNPSDRVLLPPAVTPVHYSLVLSPDLVALTFGCEEEVNVNVTEATKVVKLHSKEISIISASFLGKSTTEELVVEQISYHLKETTVSLFFPESLPLGEGTLKISFTGILNGDMAGFYKSSYSDADGNKKIMASTQFEPAVKATFAVTLIVPNHITALSNMPELFTEHLKGGKKKVAFETSPKMSTYLLAWGK